LPSGGSPDIAAEVVASAVPSFHFTDIVRRLDLTTFRAAVRRAAEHLGVRNVCRRRCVRPVVR